MDRLKGLRLLLTLVLASTSFILVRQVTPQPLLPPILVPNCGTGPSALIANVSQVLQGSSGTILFSCGEDRAAIEAGRPGSAVPQFSLPSGYTSLKMSTDPACKSGIDLFSGSSVIFGTHIGGVPVTSYNYCASYSNAPGGGLEPFTITWSEVPVAVSIDIKPGSFPNSINPRSLGTIPVAILSSPTLNVPSQLDRTSLTFGRMGDEPSLDFCNTSPEDVNSDGLADLVCHFKTRTAGFRPGDTVGILKGRLLDGTPIEGQDSVRIM